MHIVMMMAALRKNSDSLITHLKQRQVVPFCDGGGVMPDFVTDIRHTGRISQSLFAGNIYCLIMQLCIVIHIRQLSAPNSIL